MIRSGADIGGSFLGCHEAYNPKSSCQAQGVVLVTAGGGCWQCGCWQRIKATPKAGVHLPWWTAAFCAASLGVFLYMAGRQQHSTVY